MRRIVRLVGGRRRVACTVAHPCDGMPGDRVASCIACAVADVLTAYDLVPAPIQDVILRGVMAYASGWTQLGRPDFRMRLLGEDRGRAL